MGPGWFLDRVSVLCVESGLEQTFPCGQWLALDEADGLIERTLIPDAKKQEQKRRKTPYEIQVGACKHGVLHIEKLSIYYLPY